MTSPIRQIFSHTLIYTAGSVFNRLLPFLLLPIYTYYFTPEQFGLYSLVYSFWFFAALIYLFGTESTFQKLFLEVKDYEQKKQIYSSVLILVLIVSLLLSLLIYLFSDAISKYILNHASASDLIKFLSLILIVDALSRFPMILINCEQKSVLYTSINAIAVIINFSLNIILITVYNMGVEAIFYAYLTSYLVILIISFIYSSKYFRPVLNLKLFKKILSSSYLFFLYGIFLISIDLADRFILEYLKGTEEVGIYSASYRIGIVMNLVITGFKVAWIPFFASLQDKENSKDIYSKVFKYFCFAGLSIFLIFSFFAEDLVKLEIAGFSLLNERYWEGLKIIPIIMGAYFFHGLFLNINAVAFLRDKISYLVISSALGCFANIFLNLLLIPTYGLYGASIATLISYFIMFIILYLLSQKLYYISYPWNDIIRAFLMTIAFLSAPFIISSVVELDYFYILLIEIVLSITLLLYLFRQKVYDVFLKVKL